MDVKSFTEQQRALCKRLGIPWNLPNLEQWALIGLSLMSKEPEFRRSARRGHPKKQKAETFGQRRLDLFNTVLREYHKETGDTLTVSEFVRGIKKKISSRIASGRPPKSEVAELFLASEKSVLSRLSEARKITKK
jgi:hypothetical protein